MNLKNKIEAAKAVKAAKETKQYTVADTYELIKSGNLFVVKVDGVAIGAATSEADARAMIELLSHYTNGQPLTKDNVMSAGYRMHQAMLKADDIAEAGEKTIAIARTYDIKGNTFVVTEEGDVYYAETQTGKPVCNVSKLIEAGLDDDYIIKHIIASF